MDRNQDGRAHHTILRFPQSLPVIAMIDMLIGASRDVAITPCAYQYLKTSKTMDRSFGPSFSRLEMCIA